MPFMLFFIAAIPTLACFLVRRAKRPIISVAITALAAIILFWAGGFILPPEPQNDPEWNPSINPWALILILLGMLFFITMLGGIVGMVTKSFSQTRVLWSVYLVSFLMLNVMSVML